MFIDDSGIKTLFDIKGKRVFIGPPTGVQKVVSSQFIEAVTGYKMNKDYTPVKLGFSSCNAGIPGQANML